ncbi:hypothetical protein NFI96_011980 [Prochilodus magdalenae]|nr:hypothetical protein NFI96_011980 [Prochilodus magdalenae]
MEPRTGFSLLYRACSLVVALCGLHISIMLLFYLRETGTESELARPQPSVRRDTNTSASASMVTMRPTAVATTKALEKCPETPPRLVGPLRVEFSDPVNLNEISQDPRLSEGGRYTPRECVSLQKVALIIPFRHREEHLKYWLYYLHPILQRQQLDYGVYVIQQDGEETFNRAKLLNVGYAEALKEYDYDCFVFSDVDIIPADDRNIYRCFDQPRHLAVSMDKFGFRFNRIAHTRETMDSDGINSLTYRVVQIEKDKLFTKITVDIGKP